MKLLPTGESGAPVEAVRPTDESARMKLYKRESLWKPHIAQGEVAIIDMDMNGFITYLSPKALSTYGWDEVDIINKHISILYSNCDVAHGKAAFELRATEHKGAFSSFAWQRRKNEQHFWSYSESQVITDANGERKGIRKLIVELDLSVIKYKTNMTIHNHHQKDQHEAKTVSPLQIDPPTAQALTATCRHQSKGFQY
ncbi:MAG: PAS domain-containing protein [Candidatus Obscuribacterales bacterium]|jgi:PAS domain S-box-containing protein|nr:PAS domain-containing protein [Candidatus Obscuribacterales bacterium]